MASGLVRKDDIVDDLDRQIIRAIQIDPRAGFSRVAAVLGTSEQTVARRYRRLRGEGLLRVVGLVDSRHLGQSEWIVRAGCRPGGAGPLAEALARRDDVSWVTLSAGGSEIVCSVKSRSTQQRDDLLLQRLPATSQVLSMAAHALLHRYAGGEATDWAGYGDLLTPAQAEALAPDDTAEPGAAGPAALAAAEPVTAEPVTAEPVTAEPVAAEPVTAEPVAAEPVTAEPVAAEPVAAEPVTLRPEDAPLLDELARDGRCSYAALAAASGWTQGRVTRRLECLRRAGVVYFDVDLATQLLGFTTSAYLWLTVEPASLAAVGEQIASHPEVPFASAITGSANLVASVVCRDTEALYRYVTTRISAASGVRQLEISPVLRRIKQAGTRMEGPRLAAPVPAARTRAPARGRH